MCIDVDFLKAAFISLKNYFNFWKLTRSDVPRTDDGWAMLGYNRGQTKSVDNLDHQFMWLMGWWHASMVHYWLSWVKTLSMIRLTLLEPIKTSMPLMFDINRTNHRKENLKFNLSRVRSDRPLVNSSPGPLLQRAASVALNGF